MPYSCHLHAVFVPYLCLELRVMELGIVKASGDGFCVKVRHSGHAKLWYDWESREGRRMEINKDEQWIFTDLSLPSIFFEAYLPVLSGDATRVYLYAYWLHSRTLQISEQTLTERLGLTEDELRTALVELVSDGLLQRGTEAGQFNLTDLKRIELNRLIAKKDAHERAEVGSVKREEDKAKDELMNAINQSYFSGTMSPAWYRLFEKCLSDYHFTPPVVYSLVEQTRRLAKMSGPGYAQAIAETWNKAGIRTDADLNRYQESYQELRELSNQVGSYLRIRVTKEHETYLKRWSEDYGYNWTIIQHALSNVVAIDRPNFNYFEKILQTWHEQGLTTLEAIVAHEKSSQAKKPMRSASRDAKKNGGRRISYERKYSETQISQLFEPIRPTVEDPEDSNGA